MKFLELILSPPGMNFVLLVMGLALWRSRRASFVLITTAAVTLYLSSITLISGPLLALLEDYPPLTLELIKNNKVQAVVILGAGRYLKAPEWGEEDQLSDKSARRLEYGLWLAKQSNAQIIVTGGSPLGEKIAEAVIMKQVLEKKYGITNVIAEVQSNNTFENAKFTAPILNKLNYKSVYIVTHASHMKRSIASFKNFDIKGIPAPLGYNTEVHRLGWKTFIPSADGLNASNRLVHEVLGILWYKIKYYR